MMRVLALALFVVGATGCTSAFAPGSFDWGHGAAPLPDGKTRIQIGGGGGAGYGVTDVGSGSFVPSPELGVIAGGGAGVAVENQFASSVLLRAETNAGCQSPTFSGSGLTDIQLICPTAAYLGGQLNPGNNRNFALRLRGGGGADVFLQKSGGITPVPYMGGQVGAVLSQELGALEPYVDVHGGAKIGLALAPVASVGASGGTTWKLNESLSAYALLRGDLVFVGILPTVTANAQAGAFFSF